MWGSRGPRLSSSAPTRCPLPFALLATRLVDPCEPPDPFQGGKCTCARPASQGTEPLSELGPFVLLSDFLGRTEIRVADIKKDQGSKGPVTKCLLLHEVPTGEIVVRLDLQLFDEP